MNKTELVKKIASKGYSPRDAKEMLDVVCDSIFEEVLSGEEVKITGFGKFYRAAFQSREGICPLTGEPMNASTKYRMAFKCSENLKEAMN